MKVSIQTRKGLNLQLDSTCIEELTFVLTNCNGNYYTFRYKGQSFEVKHLGGGLKESKTLDLRDKPIMPITAPRVPPPQISKVHVYESAGTSLVPPGRSVKELPSEKDKYQGEMIWSHKTAPEIVIRSPSGKMVKDVDTASMYKRR